MKKKTPAAAPEPLSKEYDNSTGPVTVTIDKQLHSRMEAIVSLSSAVEELAKALNCPVVGTVSIRDVSIVSESATGIHINTK